MEAQFLVYIIACLLKFELYVYTVASGETAAVTQHIPGELPDRDKPSGTEVPGSHETGL